MAAGLASGNKTAVVGPMGRSSPRISAAPGESDVAAADSWADVEAGMSADDGIGVGVVLTKSQAPSPAFCWSAPSSE